MPYITHADRFPLDEGLRPPNNAGELNYLLTRHAIACMSDSALLYSGLLKIVKRYLVYKGIRYVYINDVIGALACARLEFVRRTGWRRFDSAFTDLISEVYMSVAAPYEDSKIAENGDVYPEGSAPQSLVG